MLQSGINPTNQNSLFWKFFCKNQKIKTSPNLSLKYKKILITFVLCFYSINIRYLGEEFKGIDRQQTILSLVWRYQNNKIVSWWDMDPAVVSEIYIYGKYPESRQSLSVFMGQRENMGKSLEIWGVGKRRPESVGI